MKTRRVPRFWWVLAGVLALFISFGDPPTAAVEQTQEVPPPAADREESQQIAALIADLGVPVGGLHAPYCMPFPKSTADDAYPHLRAFGRTAVPQLIAGLTDESTYRRAHCADLLGEIGDKRAIEPLCEGVRTEENARAWFISALGEFDDARSITALANLLSKGFGEELSIPATIESVGQMAARALVKIRASAVPTLQSSLKSKDASVRANARYALDRLVSQAGTSTHRK